MRSAWCRPSIVGWFAYKANDDYRNKQILVVRKTAETICARAAVVLQQKPKVAEDIMSGNAPLPESEKGRIDNLVNVQLFNARITAAQVWIVRSNGSVVFQRKASPDPNVANTQSYLRYNDIGEKGK